MQTYVGSSSSLGHQMPLQRPPAGDEGNTLSPPSLPFSWLSEVTVAIVTSGH